MAEMIRIQEEGLITMQPTPTTMPHDLEPNFQPLAINLEVESQPTTSHVSFLAFNIYYQSNMNAKKLTEFHYYMQYNLNPT
jgi:hypothetical protein